jgi:hypothetical protein
MPELRTCPVTGRTVALHPAWVDAPAPVAPPAPCAWCRPGPLASAPPLARLGEIRALAHPSPALTLEGQPLPEGDRDAVRRDAFGAHELIVGPHVAREANLLRVLAARVNDLRRDRRLRGFAATRRVSAGAHAAWHLYALPWEAAPEPVAPWRERERADGARTLHDDDAFAALAWAPRAPFEAWVTPARGTERFGASDPAAVGDAVAAVARRIAHALRDAPMDLILVDGAPWRIEVVPRLATPTSLEVAAGIPVHGTPPEAAAAHLRATHDAHPRAPEQP